MPNVTSANIAPKTGQPLALISVISFRDALSAQSLTVLSRAISCRFEIRLRALTLSGEGALLFLARMSRKFTSSIRHPEWSPLAPHRAHSVSLREAVVCCSLPSRLRWDAWEEPRAAARIITRGVQLALTLRKRPETAFEPGWAEPVKRRDMAGVNGLRDLSRDCYGHVGNRGWLGFDFGVRGRKRTGGRQCENLSPNGEICEFLLLGR
jgi:hypothetical protein